MDAGVPLKAPVAGVAMGLVKDGDRYQVLTDILVAEMIFVAKNIGEYGKAVIFLDQAKEGWLHHPYR